MAVLATAKGQYRARARVTRGQDKGHVQVGGREGREEKEQRWQGKTAKVDDKTGELGGGREREREEKEAKEWSGALMDTVERYREIER